MLFLYRKFNKQDQTIKDQSCQILDNCRQPDRNSRTDNGIGITVAKKLVTGD
jgi:hypothetical protein